MLPIQMAMAAPIGPKCGINSGESVILMAATMRAANARYFTLFSAMSVVLPMSCVNVITLGAIKRRAMT